VRVRYSIAVAEETRPPWLIVHPGDAPLILSMPHTGVQIPEAIEATLASAWLARKDADWWVDRLYDFAPALGATVIRTTLSRTVIDVNRDPSGKSLYPGQATTELCPTTTFDGEPLYREGHNPAAEQIAERRRQFFEPYHAAVTAQLARLRAAHANVVLYDCHSIRSRIPRLFDGTLPHFNVGTNNGQTCSVALTRAVEEICTSTGFSHVTNGRFRGGYTTRYYGRPDQGVHALQMELACRGYLREAPGPVTPQEWPIPYDDEVALTMRAALTRILQSCIRFAGNPG
jgi:N-formylglutamate deformylase